MPASDMSESAFRKLRKDPLLLTFLLILFLLSILLPQELGNYPKFVDWRTIFALAGLLTLTTGMEESAYLLFLTRKVLHRLNSERSLCLSLVTLTFLLSPVLTNDIALFITIPLTLSLRRLLKGRLSKVIVLEAIAANAGSSLTPIGNPQNLFLWHSWGVPFMVFVKEMLPLTMLLFLLLVLFAVMTFKVRGDNLVLRDLESIQPDKKLFAISFVLMVAYISALELRFSHYLLPFIFLVYMFYRKVLRKVDWSLLLIFVVAFIDFHLLSEINFVQNIVYTLDPYAPTSAFILSIFTSQLVSNVPAAIFTSKFSSDWRAICYGVNVGGNGLVIASFANLIAVRFSKDRKTLLEFHKISLTFFFVSCIAAYLLFFT